MSDESELREIAKNLAEHMESVIDERCLGCLCQKCNSCTDAREWIEKAKAKQS